MKYFIILTHLLAFMHLSAADGAPKLEWSFVDHPPPARHKLTQPEKDELEAIDKEIRDYVAFCDAWLAALLSYYEKRYPKFTDVGSADERYRAWKFHLVKVGKFGGSMCVRRRLYMDVIYRRFDVDLVFCGLFSRQATTPTEVIYVELLTEMMDYAKIGDFGIIRNLLNLTIPDSKLDLNLDIEYYFRRYLQVNDGLLGAPGANHLVPLMIHQRRQFIDAAVLRGDVTAVLETTAPCKD